MHYLFYSGEHAEMCGCVHKHKLLSFASTISQALTPVQDMLCDLVYPSMTTYHKVVNIMFMAFCQNLTILKKVKQMDNCKVKTNFD